jgi:hypothetical protein
MDNEEVKEAGPVRRSRSRKLPIVNYQLSILN